MHRKPWTEKLTGFAKAAFDGLTTLFSPTGINAAQPGTYFSTRPGHIMRTVEEWDIHVATILSPSQMVHWHDARRNLTALELRDNPVAQDQILGHLMTMAFHRDQTLWNPISRLTVLFGQTRPRALTALPPDPPSLG